MSRAFVKEDEGYEPEPTFALPEPDAPGYDEAAAWALIEGAHQGHTRSAERATGYRWGEPTLVAHVRAIRDHAKAEGEDRIVQLAGRYLRAAGAL